MVRELHNYIFGVANRDREKLRGQDLTEYALLVAFIAIIVVLAIVFFGENVSIFFSELGNTVSDLLTT